MVKNYEAMRAAWADQKNCWLDRLSNVSPSKRPFKTHGLQKPARPKLYTPFPAVRLASEGAHMRNLFDAWFWNRACMVLESRISATFHLHWIPRRLPKLAFYIPDIALIPQTSKQRVALKLPRHQGHYTALANHIQPD